MSNETGQNVNEVPQDPESEGAIIADGSRLLKTIGRSRMTHLND